MEYQASQTLEQDFMSLSCWNSSSVAEPSVRVVCVLLPDPLLARLPPLQVPAAGSLAGSDDGASSSGSLWSSSGRLQGDLLSGPSLQVVGVTCPPPMRHFSQSRTMSPGPLRINTVSAVSPYAWYCWRSAVHAVVWSEAVIRCGRGETGGDAAAAMV